MAMKPPNALIGKDFDKVSDPAAAEPLKIIELVAENFKRLKAVRIRPDGTVIQITGRNGQGKTSTLDAIEAALGGKGSVPKEPLRKGQTKGQVAVDLGRIKVTRTFKRDEDEETTTSLLVQYADGTRPKNPQAALDELIGELGFDPLMFTRLKPADQFETLKRFVPGIDFEKIEAENRRDYDERTAVGRRAKEEKASGDTIEVPLGTPEKLIDVAELQQQLADAADHNGKIVERQAKRENAAREIDEKNTQAEVMRAQADKLEKEAAELQAKLDAAPALPAKIDTAEVQRQLGVAANINEQVNKLITRQRHYDSAAQFKAKFEAFSAAIDKRSASMREAIAAAKMPIEGLGFGDKSITLDGVPFEQASAAEQLRASTAIAMAMHPQLSVILIRDGSLLDKDSMKLLADIAAKNDFQIFIERVGDGEKIGIVIEDGEVAS